MAAAPVARDLPVGHHDDPGSGALLVVLDPVKAVAFFAIHQAAFGLYMGCSFAPNHKGMPTLTASDSLDFLRKQVITSRNIKGSRLVDALLGVRLV